MSESASVITVTVIVFGTQTAIPIGLQLTAIEGTAIGEFQSKIHYINNNITFVYYTIDC